jgi:hypothetical protein
MVYEKKKDDSYFAVNQHKRRRNSMILIPIIAVAVITTGIGTAKTSTSLSGMSMNDDKNNKPIIMHFHPHLTITIEGKPMTLPGQIGIDPTLWKDHSLDQYGMQAMSDGMQGMSPLHTHDDTGTIHVESNANRTYTLGQFLDNWGGLNVIGKTVKATVDGKPVTDYRNIVLRKGEQINLQVGK